MTESTVHAADLQSLAALLEKLQPLLAGGRLDNVVDLLSLLSDVVDIADNALVEKLAGVFEGLVTVGWEGDCVADGAQRAAIESSAGQFSRAVRLAEAAGYPAGVDAAAAYFTNHRPAHARQRIAAGPFG